MRRINARNWLSSVFVAVVAALCTSAASAQSDGGLYIAGAGFSFQTAAERALSQNAGPNRFFLLALPGDAAALSITAPPGMVALRDRVVAANGVLLICQRDIANGSINPANLAPGVVPVRGWPPAGRNELPDGQRYFRGENPANLPAADEALRRLRSACS
jgi:hypothetical protein